jgi:hypothetical protein
VADVESGWTQRVPDERLMVVRLSCGHARLVARNLGGPSMVPGGTTACAECLGASRTAVRVVAVRA